MPLNPVAYILKLTNTEGDGVIEETDARQTWDTVQKNKNGEPRFPDGTYEVIVRAWDLAGNKGEARMQVEVRNESE